MNRSHPVGDGPAAPAWDPSLLPSRVLAVGLLVRSDAGDALAVQTTYKDGWEVVGGVVDPGEGLVAALRREIGEEVAVDLPVGDLLVVDAWDASPGHREIVCLLFDGGVHPATLVETLTFADGEIAAAHWVGRGELHARCGARVGGRLLAALEALDRGRLPGAPLFLHNGRTDE